MAKTEKMSIYAFRVSSKEGETEKLSRLLATVHNDELGSRYREIADTPIRVDYIKQEEYIWLLDVVRFRNGHGPGKATKETLTSGFDFKEDEEFSEETAVLYDSKSKILLMQNNYHGVKVGKLESYFSSYRRDKDNSYGLEPCLVEKANTFHNRKGVRSFDINVNLRALEHKDIAQCDLDIIKASYAHGEPLSNILKISLSVGRKRGLLPAGGEALLKKLYEFFKKNPEGVNSFKASVLPEGVDRCELVDLVAHRWKREVEIGQGKDKRFPREERFKKLKAIYNEDSDELV